MLTLQEKVKAENIYMGFFFGNLETYRSSLDQPNDVRTTIIQRLLKHESTTSTMWAKIGINVYITSVAR